MTPVCELEELDAPSIKNFQVSKVLMLGLSFNPQDLMVSSTMKLFKARALIEGQGLNSMSNSPSSITHFNNFPETSGF